MKLINSIKLRCPYCGEVKEIMHFLSGNNIEATQWSDTRYFTPMMPQVSFVQRCPRCKHYFYNTDENFRGFGREGKGTLGWLSYTDLLEAKNELEPFRCKNEEIKFRWHLLWAFNDAYCNASLDDIKQNGEFIDNVHRIIELSKIDYRGFGENVITADPLIAELHREIGEFDECLKEIYKCTWSEYIGAIGDHAEQQDRSVFSIFGNYPRKMLMGLYE